MAAAVMRRGLVGQAKVAEGLDSTGCAVGLQGTTARVVKAKGR